jgi:RNA methyltransferase, TrmH family
MGMVHSMLKITGRDNQQLKFARAVRDRRHADLIFIEGTRLVSDALTAGVKISRLFFSEDIVSTEYGLKIARRGTDSGAELLEVRGQLFSSVSDTKSPQGIIAVAERPQTGPLVIERNLNEGSPALVLVLHGINNPGNLGSVIRTAAAAGVSGVILTRNSADVFSPAALRGSMGGAFRVPVWAGEEYESVLSWAKNAGLTTLCADASADIPYSQVRWNKRSLVVFGSEAGGLSESEIAQVEQTIYIPMSNGVESLNVAVTAGIITYDWHRKSARLS